MSKWNQKVLLILRRSLTGDWLVTRPDWAGGDGERRLGVPPASQSVPVLSYDGLQSAWIVEQSSQVL